MGNLATAPDGIYFWELAGIRPGGHYLVHLVQKNLLFALTTKLLKTPLGRQCLLPHRAHPLLVILSKQGVVL
jgi:hypothetical protein